VHGQGRQHRDNFIVSQVPQDVTLNLQQKVSVCQTRCLRHRVRLQWVKKVSLKSVILGKSIPPNLYCVDEMSPVTGDAHQVETHLGLGRSAPIWLDLLYLVMVNFIPFRVYAGWYISISCIYLIFSFKSLWMWTLEYAPCLKRFSLAKTRSSCPLSSTLHCSSTLFVAEVFRTCQKKWRVWKMSHGFDGVVVVRNHLLVHLHQILLFSLNREMLWCSSEESSCDYPHLFQIASLYSFQTID